MPVSITDLIAAAKETADKIDDDQVSDAEWVRHIRNAINELHSFVADCYRDTFFAFQNFTITAPSYTYDMSSLSPVVRRVKGVDSDPDTLKRMALRPFNFQERATAAGYPLTWWRPPLQVLSWCPNRRYHVLGSTLQIQPQEIAAGDYRVYYIPAPVLPTGPTDILWSLDADLERWVEYLELAAGRRGLWKEESDTRATLDMRIREMRADIIENAEHDENPLTITDNGWGA